MTLLLAHGDGEVFGEFSAWTFALRFGQQLLQIAPHVLFGVILAGLLRTRVGQRWLRGCFEGSWPRSALRAIVVGLVAPVGALGGLPIASEMLRAGVRPSVVVCYLVTAPLFVPWSFGYAAETLGVLNGLLVVFGAVVLAFVAGAAAGALERSRPEVPPQRASSDASQLLTALRATADHSSGWLLVYVGIGLAASAGLAAILQPGAIEAHLEEGSVVTLLELSVPIALANPEPDLAVLYASEFWRVGLLTGGVFLAFYLGAGWSLGVFAWCVHRLGRVGALATIAWLFAAISIAAIGNSVREPLRPGEADSHAFDALTKPYDFGGSSAADGVGEQLRRAADGGAIALAALGVLFAVGVWGCRRRPTTASCASAASYQSIGSEGLPQGAVRATLLGAAAVCLAVSVFSYVPSPEELRDRLRLQSGNLFEAVSVLSSPRHTREAKTAAEVRALNAIDRIDDALARYETSRMIYRADATRAEFDAAALGKETERLVQLVTAGASEQLKRATLELAEALTRE